MDYYDFLKLNRNALVGYFLVSCSAKTPGVLGTPWPLQYLSEEEVESLKRKLDKCMPNDSMISDQKNWDVQLRDVMDDDWYFEAAFGAASSIKASAEELTELFLEKCDEFGIDYDQLNNVGFDELVRERACRFIVDWRENLFSRFGKS